MADTGMYGRYWHGGHWQVRLILPGMAANGWGRILAGIGRYWLI